MQLDTTRHARVPLTDEQYRAQVVSSKGFTHGQLHDTFMWLQEGKNWKLPIDKVIDHPTTDECDLIAESINYNAGGGCKFWPMPDGKVRVKAPGYYNIIGA